MSAFGVHKGFKIPTWRLNYEEETHHRQGTQKVSEKQEGKTELRSSLHLSQLQQHHDHLH